MKNIAITGSFASGKSFVINQLKQMNYQTFSCDDFVKTLYLDIEVQNQIIQEINGLEVFDKSKLAQIVYSDDQSRKNLEKIIHPMVRLGIKNFELKHMQEKLIFTEVPLLYESGFDKYFSDVICIYCSEKNRYERAISRGLKNIEIFEKIKLIQMAQNEKIKLTKYVINSDKDTKNQIEEILRKLL